MLTPRLCYVIVMTLNLNAKNLQYGGRYIHCKDSFWTRPVFFFLCFNKPLFFTEKLILNPWQQVFYNLKLKLGIGIKLCNLRGWSSSASAIWISREELGVESMYNFCCRSNLCCSVKWVITTNQSWRLPHFFLHFPPGKANYNRKAAKAAL